MNNAIGIDYGRVEELESNISSTKGTIVDDLEKMINSTVRSLRDAYTGRGGEAIANALETAATKAKSAIEEWMTQFEDGIKADKQTMADIEAEEANAGDNFVA